MNKKALLEYALFARKELETQIALSLNKLGIYKDHITKANVVGDFTIIEGTQETFPKRVYELRKSIVENEFHLKNQKFDNVVEEFAYTWFNRIVAIRFMEVHDYFPHGFRVLTSRDGAYEPEIMKNLPYVLEELDLKESVIRSLKEQNKTEELYRYVLFKQCNRLSKVFPDLFSKGEEYLELLLPNNLLSQDSIIRKLESIPEDDFLNDVEIVGWLYQYYVASNREEFRKAKVVTKDLIPTLSQIFTPDWIVRYMAENSVGRLWLESYPNSSLRSDLKYYVDDAKQNDETNKKLEEIKYKNVDPEKIKVIEPCSGSGHILVYVFDLLFKMYLEKGYNSKDIPSLILRNNLYGLDIDKRAAQLAQFSLIMKARSIDNRFFNEDRFIRPRVFEIIDSKLLKETNYRESMKSLHFSEESIKMVDFLYDTFENAKIIGSLLRVPARDYSGLMDDIKRCRNLESPNLLEYSFYHAGIDCIKYLVEVAMTLSRKYDVVITNPPYIGSTKLEKEAHDYAYSFYPRSKDDMFSMFMEVDYLKKNGFRALVNPDSWMFLESYEDLRKELLDNNTIISMIHIGMGAFDAVVQTTSFVVRNTCCLDFKGSYIRLVESKEFDNVDHVIKAKKDLYVREQSIFSKINKHPIAYWCSNATYDIFHNSRPFGDYGETKKGVLTGNDARFGRFWFEVNYLKTCDYNKNHLEMVQRNKKWIMCTSGGPYRRWYGNFEWVVNLENDGRDIRNNTENSFRLRDPSYYFRECVSWSEISSKAISIRYVPEGILFGNSGPCCFFKEHLKYFMGLLNTKVTYSLLKVLSPTLTFGPKQLKRLPVVIKDVSVVENLVDENINVCKKEWDDYECSWNFMRHPLIYGSKIKDSFEKFKNQRIASFKHLKANEEQLNEIFINNYGLESELDSKISDDMITYRLADKEREIKSLISYFIGCIMGRYSLEQEGLVYAGGTFDASKYGDYVDADGVVPIYRFVGIEDGLTTGICNMVKRVYGDTYYKENLDFIAEALGRKPEEGAEEAINRYLNDGFYEDHVKIYQKRPIYWMLSSGKQGAFKCLIYLHRYNKNTLALINTKYFLPRTAMYKAERERSEFKLVNADIREKKKIEKELTNIEACEEELLEYGQVLDHMANQFIDIDLDDGVKVNYVKFQGVELEVNGARIKKNLLVPFGLEEKKK